MRTEDAQPQELVEDSDGSVAPRGEPGVCVIGRVDEVNGRGAIAVPEFTASRHELLVLLKYWAEIDLGIEFDWFFNEQVGSSESRRRAFAARRVDRIAEALADEEAVCAALDEVHDAYGKKQDGLAWKVFTKKASADEERQFRHEQDKLLSDGPSEEWFKTMCPFEPSNLPASE